MHRSAMRSPKSATRAPGGVWYFRMPARTTRHTRWRLASRLLAALAVVLLMLWPVTYLHPVWLTCWHYGVIANRGYVALIAANSEFRVVADPSGSMGKANGVATIYLGPDYFAQWGSNQPPPGMPTSKPFAVKSLAIPPWSFAALASLLAFLAWLRARPPREPGPRCSCGYSLVGLPRGPGAKCPECGAAASNG